MAATNTVETVSLDQVHELLVEHGYEVTPAADDVLQVRDVDSGIVITSALQDNILFNSLHCVTVPSDQVNADVMQRMLAVDNGISTSAFQLDQRADGTCAVSLNNFCKLQAMGADDHDDILSCLQFLEVDAYAARDLLGSLTA